jgi:hypothetical protein
MVLDEAEIPAVLAADKSWLVFLAAGQEFLPFRERPRPPAI